MFIVGIDIAKRSHEIIVITSDNQVGIKPFRISNNCSSYNQMLSKIKKSTCVKSQIVFAMEFTAYYWLPLYARLHKDGYAVVVLNPIQTFAMREMFIRKAKTDARISLIIAELIRFGRYFSSNISYNEELKSLARYRFDKVQQWIKPKQFVSRLVNILFPELEKLVPTLHMASVYAMLSGFPGANQIAQVYLTHFRILLTEASNKPSASIPKETAFVSLSSFISFWNQKSKIMFLFHLWCDIVSVR